ncbi:MAG TPA: NUDIX domain-containing protein [Candidatus Saccharimonadales bacterium]|nr:NUDIX domain-containing protein [Candidatus Saccharimonadales bacterium]
MESPVNKRITGRVLLLDGDKALLFKRRRYMPLKLRWLEYYSIPGGGLLEGEKPAAAARRELKEELGLDVELDGEVAVITNRFFEHHLFSGRIVGGQPEWQTGSEENRYLSRYNSYEIVWLPVSELTVKNLVYYADFLPEIRRLAGLS